MEWWGSSYQFAATQNPDPFRSNVVFHIRGTGANDSTVITDISPTPKLIQRFGNTRVSELQSRFGGGSLLFDGAGDYITIDNIDLRVGSSDFTKDIWIFPRTIQPGYRTLWSHRASASGFGGALLVSDAGSLVFFIANLTGSSWQVVNFPTGLSLVANQWQFLRMTRSGNTICAARNGVIGSAVTVAAGQIGTAGNFALMTGASDGSSGQDVDAYINEFRFTKNVARSLSELPDQPFPDF